MTSSRRELPEGTATARLPPTAIPTATPTPTPTRQRHRLGRALAAAAPAALVLAAALAAYSNSFDVPLQFDDVPNIVRSPDAHAADLSLEQLGRAARGFPLGRWLARASFAVNHAIHGLRPFGYHVVNLAFHLGAALLVLAAGRRILEALRFGDGEERRRAALVAALLFAVHPVHTQAVTYVVQRMASMGAFFALLALLLWLLARKRAGGRRAGLAAAAVVAWYLAVSSKESTLVLPALVALLEVVAVPDLATLRARWKPWAGAAAGVLAAGAAALWFSWDLIEAEHARLGVPIASRLLSQGRILVHYLSLLVLPLPGRLKVDYAYQASTGLLDPPTTLPALLAVAALAAAAVLVRRRAPLATLAVGWFFVALALEQSVLPIDLVFEHRLYFADIGFLLLAGAAAVRFVRVPRAGPWAVAAPAVVLLAAGTFARNERWREPALLYPAEEGPGPATMRNLLNLGVALMQRGELDEAERVLRRAIAVSPLDPQPYVDLGNLELRRGRPGLAEIWYRAAIERGPDLLHAWYDLGIALDRQARHGEAQEAYERAMRIDPSFSGARVNWALDRLRAGDRAAAARGFDEAVRADPGSVEALLNRALVRLEEGRRTEALEDALRATRLAPDRAAAQVVLGRALLAQGRREEARATALEALRLDPRSADARALADAAR